MNERYKELEKQCTKQQIDYDVGKMYDQVDHRKLAELIVRECSGLFPNVYVEIENEYGHTPVIVADYIKKHFGIEE